LFSIALCEGELIDFINLKICSLYPTTSLKNIISNARAASDKKIGMMGADSKIAKAKYLKLSNTILVSENISEKKEPYSDSVNSERKNNIADTPDTAETIKSAKKIESLFLSAFNTCSIFKRLIIVLKSRLGGLFSNMGYIY